ncbi:hypothetical protein ACS0TY_016174 [Phlomoides rotata]
MNFSSFSNPSSSGSTSEAEKSKKKTAVKLSTDPQSVAARQRRHRISDRFKILRSLVPGGAKMDTVSMLEEAIQYVKFLKAQIWLHQAMINLVDNVTDDPTAQTNNRAVLPLCYQNVDLCDYGHVQGEVAEVGLSESWFSGEGNGNGGFDAFNSLGI